MKKEDGGGAFPQMEQVEVAHDGLYVKQWWPVGGMSLRDYFAAKALEGLLANPEMNIQGAGTQARWQFATEAYHMADAMLKAREQ